MVCIRAEHTAIARQRAQRHAAHQADVKNRHASVGIISSSEWPHSGQVIVASVTASIPRTYPACPQS